MGEVTDGGDLASRVERPGAGVRGGERYGGGRKGRENGRLPVSPLTTMGRRGGHQKETAAGKRVPRPQEVRTDRKAAAETARGDAGERAEPRPQRPPTRGHTGCRQEGPTLGGDAVRHSGPRRSGSKQTRRPPPPVHHRARVPTAASRWPPPPPPTTPTLDGSGAGADQRITPPSWQAATSAGRAAPHPIMMQTVRRARGRPRARPAAGACPPQRRRVLPSPLALTRPPRHCRRRVHLGSWSVVAVISLEVCSACGGRARGG